MRLLNPRSILSLLAAALIVTLIGVSPATAHTELVKSSPKNGSEVDELPSSIVLEFNERIAKNAAVSVSGPHDEVYGDSPVVVGKVVKVGLPKTGPKGTYVVIYRVVAEDGHSVSGEVRFGVDQKPSRGGAAFGGVGIPLLLGVLVASVALGAVVSAWLGRRARG